MSKNYIIERTVGNEDEYTTRYLLRGNSEKEIEDKIIQAFITVGVKRENIMLLEYSIDVEFDGEHYNYMILNS